MYKNWCCSFLEYSVVFRVSDGNFCYIFLLYYLFHLSDICGPGEYSQQGNGLANCLACPLGTYQPNFRQSSCMKCPNGKSTKVLGTVSKDDCEWNGERHKVTFTLIWNAFICTINSIPFFIRSERNVLWYWKML